MVLCAKKFLQKYKNQVFYENDWLTFYMQERQSITDWRS